MSLPGCKRSQKCFCLRGIMDNLEHHHYKLSKLYLSTIGLWPYDNNWSMHVKRVFFIVVMFTSSFFLFTAYFRNRTNCGGDILITALSYLICTIIFTLKYFTFWYKMNSVRTLIDMVRENWLLLHNKNEERIILEYAQRGKLLNLIFSSTIFAVLVIYMFLNITKSYDMEICESFANVYVTMDYFTYNKKIYYLIFLHTELLLILGAAAILGAEVTTIVFTQHVSGMFHVVRCRIRAALTDKGSKTARDIIHRERMLQVVKMHQRTLDFCRCLGDTVGSSYFVLLLLGVACTSINLSRISGAKLQTNDLKILMMEMSMIATCFAYLFLTNHMGQTIMDNSAELLYEAYGSQWYTASVPVQKLLLFIMENSVKPYLFTIGGLFVPCYEGFATLTRMSFSYFMFIQSSQT